MIRSIAVTLLCGALAALLGWAYLARPVEDQERLKRPILAICAVAITIGLALMIGSLLP
jgi:hypothetical protein